MKSDSTKNNLSLCFIIFACLFCHTAFAQDATWLTDVSREVGLDSTIGGTRVILADVNGDNYPDLLWGSGNINKNRFYLYLNVPNPDLSSPNKRIFRDFTLESNINANRNPNKTGRIVDIADLVDVDNDGDLDLVTSIYYHRLQMYLDTLDPGDRSEVLLNDGTGHFTLKLDNGLYQYGLTNATGMGFLDYDLDGNIDLYLGTWWYDYAIETKQPDVLFKGNGDGSFTYVSNSGVQSVSQPIYGINVTDFDNDGWQDVFTSAYCRSGGSLFRNQGNGTFLDVAPMVGYTSQLIGGDGGQALCQWSAQPADFDNDGDMDILHINVHGGYNDGEGRTHISVNGGAENSYHYTWELDRIIRDAPAETHLGDQGGIWFDLDGDGWQDIAIGQMGYPTANTKGQERLYILKQNSEHYFDDVSKAVGIYYTMKEAHSVQPGDFDLDGDQDLFFSRQVRDTTYRDTIINGQTQKVPVLKNYMRIFLLRNDIGNKNNWVSVKLDPPQGSNKSGLGSRITVCADSMKFISEIQTGYGHFAGEQPFIKNIGIGKLNRIDSIVVRWQVKGFPTSVIYNPALNMILGINGNSQLSYVKPWTDKKPVISFSKPALRFDTISIGNNQEQSFDVKNLGDTTLVVSDMTLDSSASTVYSILGKQVPFSLAPDETKNINIKFTPLVRADYHKTIRFSSNAQNAPERNYDLIGSGYAPAPVIIADSISLTFNPAWVDTLRQRSFQVNNPGEEALVLSDFSFESDSMNVFSIDKSSLPITIQPKSSQTLTVSFKPVKLGVSNANLLITSNAYNGASLKVKLSGTCDGPAPSIYSNTLVMFGTVPINLFKEKIIWILNNGNADLHISGITVEDDTAGVYTISDLQYPYSVHPDDTLFVTVRFTPKQTISYNKTLIISSDAFSSPTRKVNLKGTGDPAVSVAEATKLLLFTMKVQPNPAETNAKLIFELNGGEPQSVHLELYSTAGIKIRDIANESINPGSYSSELNTSALPAGVYYISAKVGQYLYHTKLILLK